MKKIIFLLLLTIFAYSKSITASFTYTLGDRDTKIEAKKIAFEQAKRIAIENIGVWIQSETNIIDGELKDDKINLFVLGFAKTKIISESFEYPNYTVSVEVTIDEEQLEKNMPHKKPVEVKQEKKNYTLKREDTIKIQNQPIETIVNFKKYEIGLATGSSNLNIVVETPTTETKGSQKIGYTELKAIYNFTKNHAVELRSGGGSVDVGDTRELAIGTSSLSYIYHFNALNNNQTIPFAQIGLLSGVAIYTSKATSREIFTHKGSGAIMGLGVKHILSKNRAHAIGVNFVSRGFSYEDSYSSSDDDDDEKDLKKIISYSVAGLVFSYMYRF